MVVIVRLALAFRVQQKGLLLLSQCLTLAVRQPFRVQQPEIWHPPCPVWKVGCFAWPLKKRCEILLQGGPSGLSLRSGLKGPNEIGERGADSWVWGLGKAVIEGMRKTKGRCSVWRNGLLSAITSEGRPLFR